MLKPLTYDSPEPIYLITDASLNGLGGWCSGEAVMNGFDRLRRYVFSKSKSDKEVYKATLITSGNGRYIIVSRPTDG